MSASRHGAWLRGLRAFVALLAIVVVSLAGLWAYDAPFAQLAIANLWSLCGVSR